MKRPILLALPLVLAACASQQQTSGVSPRSHQGDPSGFVGSLIGKAAERNSDGEQYWKIERTRLDSVQLAIAGWCSAQGGAKPEGTYYMFCRAPGGKLIAQFDMSPSDPQSTVVVYEAAQAQKLETARLERQKAVQRYMSSGGASGSVTLTNGTRLDVLRFGTTRAAINYLLDGPGARDLREVRSIERLARREQAGAEFKVVFADGNVTTGKHTISNYYRTYPEGQTFGISTEVGFAGISSNHITLVVRRSANAKPTNALVAVRDIAKLEITAIDTKPAVSIVVAETDPALERALLVKWRAAASGMPRRAFNPATADRTGWCSSRGAALPIELNYFCSQLSGELNIAERQGYWSADTTPASMIDDYNIYKLVKRTIL